MMKQKLFLTIALLLGILAPHSVLGYGFYATAPTGQRLYYTITNSITRTVTVVSQNTSYPYYSSNAPSGVLEIPASVTYYGTSYSVTSIGQYAFRDCTGLTSVTIPNSVTGIGNKAFLDCRGLTSVTIPDSVIIIGNQAFQNCTGLTSVAIGNSVTIIGDYAFWGCTGLTSVTIGNSVTCIGQRAFYGCTGLTSVTIPNSVTSIEGGAFYGCTGLTSVTIPNSVTSIRDGAFSGCSGLTSVTIPNSVTSIGGCAFQGCTGLTSVTIGNSVTSIGGYAFQNCTGLTTINYNAVNCGGDGFTSDTNNRWLFGCTALTSVNIGNSVARIPNYAFYNCTSLNSVTIPNSVTSIGEYAFQNCSGLTTLNFNADSCGGNGFSNSYHWLSGCTSLTTLNIGNNVRIIPNYFARRLTGLTSVTIPNSVTSIGSSAFARCSGLTSVTIGSSVTSIGNSAFLGCTGLSSVTIGNSVTSIGEFAFQNCTGLTSVTIPNSVTIIGEYAFSICPSLSSITIPNSVAQIKTATFWKSGLTGTLTIPNSVTSIGRNAFDSCVNLQSVILPNSLSKLDTSVFRYCSGLTSVTIPNSVTSIGDWALGYCTSLTSVTIPDSVTSIGASAFEGCTGLTSVTIPNSVTSIGGAAFSVCTGLTSVTIPNSVTRIAGSAFFGCTGLTSVTIPDSVTSIGASAFEGCTGLTSVTIPNSVTSIGGAAFSVCTGLTSVTIPNSVTSIGNGAFSGCSGLTTMNYNAVNCGGDGFTSDNNRWLFGCTALTSVNIGNSVARIPNYAFLGCTGLTHVTIPNSVTSIGEAAFLNCTNLNTINYNATNCSGDGFTIANGSSSWLRGCSSLTRVNVGNNVRSIPENAFYNCTSLHVLDLGSGLTSVGANAFYNCDHLDSIYSRSTTPPTVANTNAFENVWKGLPLTVPTGSRSAYAVAYAWRDFTNIVEMSAAQFTVIVNVNDASMGTVTGGGTYAQGATATLSATANTGYRFVQWNDGNTQNPRTVTVTADATYMAFFAANQYTVAVYTNDSTMGTVTGGGTYAYGTTATLTATPNTGYTFTQWQDGNTDNPRTVTVSADATYIAFFAADQYTVTVFTNDSTMGTVTGGETYAQGATATLTATPNTGYTFTQWQDGNTDNPRTVTVTGNATYMAYFAADQSNAPQIAYVGVDSNGHNAVSWTPQSGTSPVRYNVYREGIQAGVYELVGVVNASGATSYSWTDDQSNPATRAYSYRLAEVAADNTESDLSIPHTTIHLQISQGQGDAWNLAWTPYVGFNYSTYNLYRGTDASSMTLLTTLPATATTYSDLNTGGTAYYYQIEVVQLSGAKTTAVSSRSNIVTTDPDPQTYTLTVLSADVLRGTVTGGGSYTEGTMATLTAEANEGYVFLQWQDGSTANPRNILVTANGTYMAYFTQTEGIADAEGSNVTIIARNGRILVSGAEGRQVTLSDALGRILYRGTATEPLTVEAPATGIYLLQVEGYPAHRISVVR